MTVGENWQINSINFHELSWNFVKSHDINLDKSFNLTWWHFMTYGDISWHMIFGDISWQNISFVMIYHDKSWYDSTWFREGSNIYNYVTFVGFRTYITHLLQLSYMLEWRIATLGFVESSRNAVKWHFKCHSMHNAFGDYCRVIPESHK